MDPYYLIRQEVVTGTNHLRELLDTRTDMLNDPRGINVEVFQTLGIQLANEVQKVKGLVRDIEDSIDQINANRSNFQISDVELSSRVQFIKQTVSDLSEIEERMKQQSMNERVAFHPVNTQDSHDESERVPRQEQLLVDRQEQIELIEQNVNAQLHYAKAIDRELEEQQEIMLTLDGNIDNAHEAMKDVTQRIKTLIENEGTVPTTIVVILAIVLIFLLFIAI